MKTAIISQNDKKWLIKILKTHGFEIVHKNPDLVIANGGDGTILYSERLYPGIPKVAVKTSKVCRKCDYTPQHFDILLHRIANKKYKIIEMAKVEARFKGKRLVALNEIQVRHKNPTVAIRFSVSLNGKKIENIIGDGVIVATPFGSTAYYKSAGGKAFKRGMGIVFNNMYSDGERSFVLPDKAKIRVRVDREDAFLIRDNDNKFYTVKSGEQVTISLAKEKARFLQF